MTQPNQPTTLDEMKRERLWGIEPTAAEGPLPGVRLPKKPEPAGHPRCECGQTIWGPDAASIVWSVCGDCRRDAKRKAVLKDFDRSLSLERKIDKAREYGDVGPWDARDADYES
jgi:hypothetical protein